MRKGKRIPIIKSLEKRNLKPLKLFLHIRKMIKVWIEFWIFPSVSMPWWTLSSMWRIFTSWWRVIIIWPFCRIRKNWVSFRNFSKHFSSLFFIAWIFILGLGKFLLDDTSVQVSCMPSWFLQLMPFETHLIYHNKFHSLIKIFILYWRKETSNI